MQRTVEKEDIANTLIMWHNNLCLIARDELELQRDDNEVCISSEPSIVLSISLQGLEAIQAAV
jgi:hypothetical protein